jgi:F-type H+-transporting ATPase subunit delta
MTTRGSAARYARALLDVAIEESMTEQVERDLSAFAELFARHADLQRALTHPAVPAARKRALTTAVTSRIGTIGPVAKLLLMLADRDRLALVPDLLATYRERLLEHQRVIRAEVTTAEPLTEARAAELRERIARATGLTVMLTTRVDAGIIGGIVTRIGSVVYDGSIAAQLARMRDRLERQV